MRAFDRLPPGVTIVRDPPAADYSILECRHDAPTVGVLCSACRAPLTETRPVKFLAIVRARAEQEALF